MFSVHVSDANEFLKATPKLNFMLETGPVKFLKNKVRDFAAEMKSNVENNK